MARPSLILRTVAEMKAITKLSKYVITKRCQEGALPGAFKERLPGNATRWLIPEPLKYLIAPKPRGRKQKPFNDPNQITIFELKGIFDEPNRSRTKRNARSRH